MKRLEKNSINTSGTLMIVKSTRFLSQGQYPIKGLHYVRSNAIDTKKFPQSKVYISGKI